MRLDKVVATLWSAEVPDEPASRAAVQRWIDAGQVLIDGAPGRATTKVAAGQALLVSALPPETTTAEPDASVTFPVLYEDASLLVLDKPAGLVVHPARGHLSGTLVNGLLARGGFEAGVPADEGDPLAHLRPGIVHRLDKGTSGVMVVAKTDRAREGLKRLFQEHDIERSYVAIAVGETSAATITSLHGRGGDRLRFTTHVDAGKRAVTHVAVVERLAGGACTLVRCTLETGRTHQIRVHLAEIARTPVLGDPLYGRPPKDPWVRGLGAQLGRQALHAEVLGFRHPVTGELLRFETKPPPDMARAIEELRARV